MYFGETAKLSEKPEDFLQTVRWVEELERKRKMSEKDSIELNEKIKPMILSMKDTKPDQEQRQL